MFPRDPHGRQPLFPCYRSSRFRIRRDILGRSSI